MKTLYRLTNVDGDGDEGDSMNNYPPEPTDDTRRFRCGYCPFWHLELIPLINHYESVELPRMEAAWKLQERISTTDFLRSIR